MASVEVLLSPRVPASASPVGALGLDLGNLLTLCSGNLDALFDEAGPYGLSPGRAAGSAPTGSRIHQHAETSSGRLCSSVEGVDAGRDALLAKARQIRSSWQYQVTGRASAAAVIADVQAKHVSCGGPRGMSSLALELICKHGLEDTFYVYDLGNVTRLMRAWQAAMPRVQPFYAIKCNPEPAVMRLLAAMGAGFDCASKHELETVLAMGVPQHRIVFAHPCKRIADLHYAAQQGIGYTTFDTESELHKIAAHYPAVKCVLRIRCDDPEARVPLGLKYGANLEDAFKLLQLAASLNLAVVGVSFHVGSSCQNLAAYDSAIAAAATVFEAATACGHEMEVLDIGGGFTGQFDHAGNVKFGDIARTINAALAAHFPPEGGIRVIAEPGRYFAETAGALFTAVYGTRDRPAPGGEVHKDYWLTDGLYGSFNCILYDDQKPLYQVLRSPLLPAVAAAGGAVGEYVSTLWGPTCDSADYVYKDVLLPQLRVGDWLMFPNTGAYTVAGACDFNGIEFTTPTKFYIFSDSAVDYLAAPPQQQQATNGAMTSIAE